jgi:23S rRNA pseudouridine1911/1915/1917 synthase
MKDNPVITISHEGTADRLDKIILAELAERLHASRSQVAKWIEKGSVEVNGERELRPGAKVQPGSTISLSVPPPDPTHLTPYDYSLEILFEDEHLMVINKPFGLSMHPGAGNRVTTLANAVVAHVGANQRKVGEEDRPGIVHRLDKDTTGVVVVAKSVAALTGLSKQFNDRTIKREYLSLVFTTPRAKRAVQLQDSGEVDAPIGRHPTERTKMAVSPEGRSAVTKWRVVERFSYGTLLANTLQTGRTHQIRVHMDSIGSPVIGDTVYGDFSGLPKNLKEAADRFGRQALHAATLGFFHPLLGTFQEFSAPLPNDMESLVLLFRSFKG